MSSDFFLRLPQLLPRHPRQVILLVVRHLALPHDKDDLQPFRSQRSERLVMGVSPGTLLVVVRPGPLARAQREECDVIDHGSQRLVAGEAEVDDPLLLAAALRHGHGACVSLQMPKRLPSPWRVAEAGPERWRGDAVLTDR